MRIHHIGCGTMSPYGGKWIDGFSHGLTARLVCHCWLLETANGLVLIDTGLGPDDDQHPRPRLSSFVMRANRSPVMQSKTALEQVRRLGFTARDVRHIVLTHMDFDCAGGIPDFPEAQVHVLASEFERARHPRSWLDRQRYSPQPGRDERRWNVYATPDEWFGFAAARDLYGVPADIWLVALPGHTCGHAGVAVRTETGWMLHAGDAYFYRQELEPEAYRCTPGLRFYQRMMEADHGQRVDTLRRLRALVLEHSDEVRVCSSHDAIELVAYQAQQLALRQLGSRPLRASLT